MDVPSSRLYEDLADSFRGELLVDPVARATYASDASPFEIKPLAVACPRDADDVVTIVRYAAEKKIPVIPRGGGSGPAGGALGEGIIVDLSRFLRQIGPIDGDTIRVEAGVTLDELNRHLRPQGWMFGPDPMTATSTTIGGMLAVNAAGARARMVGDVRDSVVAIEMILADGQPVIVRDCENGTTATAGLPALTTLPVKRLLLDQQTHGMNGDSELAGVIHGQTTRWPRLFVGSEGTLGIFTAATLRLQRIPNCRGAVLLAFRSLEAAVLAVPEMVAASVAACDLFDRRLISLAREAHSPWRDLFSSEAEAALLVEWFADSPTERTDRLHSILAVAAQSGSAVEVCRVILDNAEADSVWTMPSGLVQMLSRLPGTTRPLSIFADVWVPVEQMEAAIVPIQRIWQHHGLTVALHAHAASGALHFYPVATPPSDETSAFWATVIEEVEAVVHSVGGCCGKHRGRGLAWAGSRRRHTPGTRAVLRSIKELFDPLNLLNPGKEVGESAPYPVERFRLYPSPVQPQPLLLKWSSQHDLSQTVSRCSGCGQCRTTSPTERMCPFFRVSSDEIASPRAKATTVRQWEQLPADSDAWNTPAGKRLLETCFNCKQCVVECPSEVDIPQLIIEHRAQRVGTHGLSHADWYLTRIPDWMPWLRYAAVVGRTFLQRAWFRWLVEKFTSITRHRRFPTWRTKPFLQTAPKTWRIPPATLNDRVVIYFVDHVANWHEPEIALAAGKILEHHGFQVHVPVEQVRSGMDLVTCGDLDRARMFAEKNIATLGEFARAGCRIVCTEPTAAVCLKVEYPRLIDHPDAQNVAQAVEDIGTFLARLEATDELRTDFQPRPVRAAYHLPCHLRALGSESTLQKLCSLIPGVTSPKIEAGCSGMAGSFGWAKETYEQSVEMGRPVAQAWESVSATVALSECSSCRQQLEHLTHRRSQHPLVLLAEAYGLLKATSPSR